MFDWETNGEPYLPALAQKLSPVCIIQFWGALCEDFDSIISEYIEEKRWSFSTFAQICFKHGLGDIFYCTQLKEKEQCKVDPDEFYRFMCRMILDCAKNFWLNSASSASYKRSPKFLKQYWGCNKGQVGAFFLLYMLYLYQPKEYRSGKSCKITLTELDTKAARLFYTALRSKAKLTNKSDTILMKSQVEKMTKDLLKLDAFEYRIMTFDYNDAFPALSALNYLRQGFYVKNLYQMKYLRDILLEYSNYGDPEKLRHSLNIFKTTRQFRKFIRKLSAAESSYQTREKSSQNPRQIVPVKKVALVITSRMNYFKAKGYKMARTQPCRLSKLIRKQVRLKSKPLSKSENLLEAIKFFLRNFLTCWKIHHSRGKTKFLNRILNQVNLSSPPTMKSPNFSNKIETECENQVHQAFECVIKKLKEAIGKPNFILDELLKMKNEDIFCDSAFVKREKDALFESDLSGLSEEDCNEIPLDPEEEEDLFDLKPETDYTLFSSLAGELNFVYDSDIQCFLEKDPSLQCVFNGTSYTSDDDYDETMHPDWVNAEDEARKNGGIASIAGTAAPDCSDNVDDTEYYIDCSDCDEIDGDLIDEQILGFLPDSLAVKEDLLKQPNRRKRSASAVSTASSCISLPPEVKLSIEEMKNVPKLLSPIKPLRLSRRKKKIASMDVAI